MEIEWLDEEHQLIKPSLSRSNAGVLPAAVRGLRDPDGRFNDLKGYMENLAVNQVLEDKIKELFPGGYDNIIFFICDAVGVERLEALGGMLWENVTKGGGTVAHCAFPTLTTTNMTTISYGMHPGEHGFVGYNIYNENVDAVFNGLNGKYRKDSEVRSIHEHPNSAFVSGTPISQVISNSQMPITFFVPAQLERDGLLRLISGETPLTEYQTPEELVGMLMQELGKQVENQFVAVYIGYADHYGHEMGPHSREYAAAIRGIEQIIGAALSHPKVQAGNTLVIMTSDHGQSELDHEISRWLSEEEVENFAKEGVVLSTSGRVLHAYTKDLEKGRKILEDLADGKGVVIDQGTALELVGSGKWGDRIGDLLLVMDDGFVCDVPEVVKYGESEDRHKGQHGSLSVSEVFVPIGVWGGRAL